MNNSSLVMSRASNPKNYRKCKKKLYRVKLSVPPIGSKVYNRLENSSYVTSEKQPFVITGTVGEQWVVDWVKLCKTYVVINSKRMITKEDVVRLMKTGESLTLQTRVDSTNATLNYCYHVPLNIPFEVSTSWGTTLMGNRKGIPHGKGDYIICSVLSNGQPNLSDRWIVNGEVFDKTYTLV